MRQPKRWWMLLALMGALCLAPRPASAQEFDLTATAGVWTAGPSYGLFTFGLDALWKVAPGFQLGFKPGFLLTTSGDIPAGIPLDGKARLNVGPVYVDGFVGPWFFFKGDVVRFHAGMGAGVRLGRFMVGGEVAYLHDGATFSGLIGFQL